MVLQHNTLPSESKWNRGVPNLLVLWTNFPVDSYWKVWIGLPLGTRLGISLRKFSGLAFGSSKPFRRKSISWWNSSFDRLSGVISAASRRARTGAIGPVGPRRSGATSAVVGSYLGACPAGLRWKRIASSSRVKYLAAADDLDAAEAIALGDPALFE